MKTIILQDITHHNIGDLISCPTKYYTIENPVVADIRSNKIIPHNKNDLLLVGGGGLLRDSFLNNIEEILPKYNCKKATIAIGHNFDNFDMLGKYPDTLNKFDLVGTRDYEWDTTLKLYQYSPCPSCLHPLFDELINQKIENELFIYTHKDHGLKGDDNNSVNTNIEERFVEILTKISKAEYVITNTYHGVLWATWLNKKVICIPLSTRFFYFSHPPVFANNLTEAKQKLKEARNYPEALSFDRFYARNFKNNIDHLVNNNLTVAYNFGSKNLGDNLAWFGQVLKHIDKPYIKNAYIKTSWKPLFEKLVETENKNISFKKPTDRIYDRYYNLSVGCVPKWREKNVELMACEMLGMAEQKPNRYDLSNLALIRPLNGDYITYASEGSWAWKGWQYPDGWNILKKMIKEKYNMDMINVSLEAEEVSKDIIEGALTYIYHSKLFVGGPSGLTWLAYYLGKKPILLSGISKQGQEMDCWDIRPPSDYKGCKECYCNVQPFPTVNKCPLDKNYECWLSITPDRVMEMVDKALSYI